MTTVNYGLDAPGWIWGLSIGAAILIWTGPLLVPAWLPVLAGLGILAYAGALVFYSRHGKLLVREELLDLAGIGETDKVLDVGVGKGLLAIGAAKRASSGRVTGIDVWSTRDLSGNSKERTEANARAEGVDGRLELRSQDATRVTELGQSFDAVVSLMCIHNIPKASHRDQALEGVFEVLEPGGRFVIGDWLYTKHYARKLAELGAKEVKRTTLWRHYAPPKSIVAVSGRKSAG